MNKFNIGDDVSFYRYSHRKFGKIIGYSEEKKKYIVQVLSDYKSYYVNLFDLKLSIIMKKHTCIRSCRHKNPLIKKDVYYFATYERAYDYAKNNGYPTNAIIGARYGYAIQLSSRSFVGPHTGVRMKGLVQNNPISDKQALALTRKVIAAGKKLFLHEKGEIRRRKNPIEARHVQGFIKGIKEVEKYVVGSRPYIEALARAYGHLEKAKEEMKKTAA